MACELIVALDVSSLDAVRRAVQALPKDVKWYKVGLELFTSEGRAIVDYLRGENREIFLDLKLHDIPRTVSRAVAAASRFGVRMMTVHASGGAEMLKAAAAAAAEVTGTQRPLIVAVTTLTSLNAMDLQQLGVARALSEHTLLLGQLAIESGVDGLVCSPQEIKTFRGALGRKVRLVTPGIRPAGADVGDQKRVGTPASAVQDGSDFLVVGRPILEAADPAAAARSILEQMRGAETGAAATPA